MYNISHRITYNEKGCTPQIGIIKNPVNYIQIHLQISQVEITNPCPDLNVSYENPLLELGQWSVIVPQNFMKI